MSRNRPNEELAADHDSFLDIVANIVGILIILVMVVSVRAKNAPVETSEVSEPPVDMSVPNATYAGLRQHVARLAVESQQVDHLLAARQQERQSMALMLAASEQELGAQRAKLNERDREFFDLQNELDEARNSLEKVELERIRAAGIEPEIVQVESLPTPISKTVFDKEMHFQLRAGRVAFAPIEDLFEEARQQARQKVWKLDGLPEATETVGPKGGFRMRYTLEKLELPASVRAETGHTGFMIRSKLWELIPTDSSLGEPLETALQPGSQFRRALASMDPKMSTITLWTYPDSFDMFRQLKKELFRLGFATAARPLPAGVRIAGSPNGSRSTAQ